MQDELLRLLPQLRPQDLPDLLHVASNALDPKPAVRILQYFNGCAQELQQLRVRHQQQLRDAPAQRRRGLMILHKGNIQLPPCLKQLRLDHQEEESQLQAKYQQVEQQLAHPGLMDALLATAATRGHDELVKELVSRPAFQVSAEPTAAALQCALQQKNTAMALMLFQSTAAQSLPASGVLALLELAVERSQSATIWALLRRLQVVQRTPVASVVSLLQTAVHMQNTPAVEALCKLPAAADVSSRSIAAMLEVAVGSRDPSTVQLLLLLPSSQLVNQSTLTDMIMTALRQKTFTICSSLLQQQSAQLLSAGVLAELALTAVQSNNLTCLDQLLAMPQAANIRAAATARLLQASLDTGILSRSYESVLKVLQLNAAHSITSDQLRDLLQAAVHAGASAVVERLCQLQAAQQLAPEVVGRLCFEALTSDMPTIAAHLCRLPQAQQLDAHTVGMLMKAALQMEEGPDHTILLSLSNIASAQQSMDASTVEDLVRVAMKGDSCSCTSTLLGLPAAGQLSSSTLADLLWLELNLGSKEREDECGCVSNNLCSLLAVAEPLPAARVAELLVTAVQNYGTVSASAAIAGLCGVPESQVIGPSHATTILKAAMQLPDVMGYRMNGSVREVLPIKLPIVSTIAELTGGHAIEASVVMELLQQALRLDKRSMLLHLTALQAAQHMTPEDASNILQLAVELGRIASLDIICKLPAMSRLSAGQVVTALHAAMTLGQTSQGALTKLSSLPAAAQLQAEEVCNLLLTVMQRMGSVIGRAADAVKVLCKLPGAAALSPGQLQELMRTALQLTDSLVMQHLCGMDAAKQLEAACIAQLIGLAEQQCNTGAVIRQQLRSLSVAVEACVL